VCLTDTLRVVTLQAFGCELDEDRTVLVVRGELDEAANYELGEAIAKSSGDHTSDLAVDLGEVTFLPSTAIGVLAASKAASRRNFTTITLVAPPGSVAHWLLTICAIDHVADLD
jgi:anti-anti-sigma factor